MLMFGCHWEVPASHVEVYIFLVLFYFVFLHDTCPLAFGSISVILSTARRHPINAGPHTVLGYSPNRHSTRLILSASSPLRLYVSNNTPHATVHLHPYTHVFYYPSTQYILHINPASFSLQTTSSGHWTLTRLLSLVPVAYCLRQSNEPSFQKCATGSKQSHQ